MLKMMTIADSTVFLIWKLLRVDLKNSHHQYRQLELYEVMDDFLFVYFEVMDVN